MSSKDAYARLAITMFVCSLLLASCAETVRCPDDQVFADDGDCVPIPDAGTDAAPADGG